MKLVGQQKSATPYEYGAVMLRLKHPQTDHIRRSIDIEDIFHGEGLTKSYVGVPSQEYGIPDDIHCTLLYGLHDVPVKHVLTALQGIKFGSLRVKNPSTFQQKGYEVLKWDVDGESALRANSSLVRLPHTNEYPEYHPHVTIAYLKPGKSSKYVSQIGDIKNKFADSIEIVYSSQSGDQYIIEI